jgi:hypothetical protein
VAEQRQQPVADEVAGGFVPREQEHRALGTEVFRAQRRIGQPHLCEPRPQPAPAAPPAVHRGFEVVGHPDQPVLGAAGGVEVGGATSEKRGDVV